MSIATMKPRMKPTHRLPPSRPPLSWTCVGASAQALARGKVASKASTPAARFRPPLEVTAMAAAAAPAAARTANPALPVR
eukprot:6366826-Lingulodinium_polyedra.AAC.1